MAILLPALDRHVIRDLYIPLVHGQAMMMCLACQPTAPTDPMGVHGLGKILVAMKPIAKATLPQLNSHKVL